MNIHLNRRKFLQRLGTFGAGLGACMAMPSLAWSQKTSLAQSAQGTSDTARIASPVEHRYQASNLMPNMTFDNFVVGESNKVAYGAAMAVGDHLGSRWNSMVIYGGAGLGKTHLLHAIGNRAIERNPGTRIMYISSETFLNELIQSIRYDRMAEFRKRHRNRDLLLIDDVQFFAGKEKTQEEFFHTFNSIHESHKQIVLTSSEMPREIPDLDERLRSRFQGGLTVSIGKPDKKLRLDIVHQKAEFCGVRLPDNVKRFIAGRRKSQCIRALEGDVTRIHTVSSLCEKEIDLAYAQDILKTM